ncbi:MAG: hypothetical protein K5766_01895 [Alphaproteobacteria bacterium]|nr:hypothetical protein [Alphaproteobacteria bacterium]MCR4555543.1 hypothetical protein [Alphaproteobacteria bacterium]
MRFLFLLLSVCCFSSVHADVVWPSMYIASAQGSIPIIISGLLIEIGFVKYFTKVGWIKTIVVTTVMNAVSATVGLVFILISGLVADAFASFVTLGKTGTFHWFHWLTSYVFAILTNTMLEGIIIKLIMKLPISKTFRWLFVANAITIVMCAIHLYLFPIHIG